MYYINDGEVDVMIEGTSANRCTQLKTLKVMKKKKFMIQMIFSDNIKQP